MFMAILYISIGIILLSTSYWNFPLKVVLGILLIVYGLFRGFRSYKAIAASRK
jgi:uncharacterized membrane protein